MHEYYYVVAIPVINGLVEAAKRAGLPNRFAPLLALALGIGGGIGFRSPEEFLLKGVLEGIVIGLSAVGIYSGTRNVLMVNKNNSSTS